MQLPCLWGRSRESYQRLFDAGADRYLLRHETADENHYSKLHPEYQTLENRKACLKSLKKSDFRPAPVSW